MMGDAMSIATMIGKLLQDGISQNGRQRLERGARDIDARADGAGEALQRFVAAKAGNRDDLVASARDFLSKKQGAGLTGAGIGGLGAAVGAMLGGGVAGAARGGAMAILGTLAYNAWKSGGLGGGGDDEADHAPRALPSPETVAAMTGEAAQHRVLAAMIGAMQADGRIDDTETARLTDHLSGDDVTEADKAAAQALMARTVTVEEIAQGVDRREVAVEVYLAALLATEIDAPEEHAFLDKLAGALALDADIVKRLHQMTALR